MTNKMPVVGKIYNSEDQYLPRTIIINKIIDGDVFYRGIGKPQKMSISCFDKNYKNENEN